MISMRMVYTKFSLMLTNNKGQGLVEYALILMLIAIVVFAALRFLGVELEGTYDTINSSVNSAGK